MSPQATATGAALVSSHAELQLVLQSNTMKLNVSMGFEMFLAGVRKLTKSSQGWNPVADTGITSSDNPFKTSVSLEEYEKRLHNKHYMVKKYVAFDFVSKMQCKKIQKQPESCIQDHPR